LDISSNGLSQFQFKKCCDAAWAGRRPLVLSRRLKLAAAGPLSGLATSARRQRAGSHGDKPRPGSGLDAATARPARGRARFGPRSGRGTRRRPQGGARAGPARWVRWPSFFLAPAPRPRARAAMLKQAPRAGRARLVSRAGSRTIMIRPKRKAPESQRIERRERRPIGRRHLRAAGHWRC
jgi:hypothetical protein